MKIGFIGTGNMGRILIEAFVESKAVTPSSLHIYNRTKSKALDIQMNYKNIRICDSEIEVAKTCDIIFCCTKPLEMKQVLTTIKDHLQKKQCLVSITSPITTEQLQSAVPCYVARIIPSITNRSLTGATLYTFPYNLPIRYKEHLLYLLNQISKPIELSEEYTRITSDIVSCGPAFISFLLQRFIEAASEETNIPKDTASVLTTQMIIGFGKLLEENFYTLESLQEKVCVRGGITGEGIKALEKNVGTMFNEVFVATQHKFAEDKEHISNQFKV